jgi:hypothetical protein
MCAMIPVCTFKDESQHVNLMRNLLALLSCETLMQREFRSAALNQEHTPT